jgi:hypothetical protein
LFIAESSSILRVWGIVTEKGVDCEGEEIGGIGFVARMGLEGGILGDVPGVLIGVKYLVGVNDSIAGSENARGGLGGDCGEGVNALRVNEWVKGGEEV